MPHRDEYAARGWYDEIMRGQLYDVLIPAYEALQERMVADHAVSPVFMGLVKGFTCLLRLRRLRLESFLRRLPLVGPFVSPLQQKR
jgi:hypothetical protein